MRSQLKTISTARFFIYYDDNQSLWVAKPSRKESVKWARAEDLDLTRLMNYLKRAAPNVQFYAIRHRAKLYT